MPTLRPLEALASAYLPLAVLRLYRAVFGPVFTLHGFTSGDPLIVVASRPEVKRLLADHSLIGSPHNLPLRDLTGHRSVLALEGPQHLTARRWMLSALKRSRVERYAASIEQMTLELLQASLQNGACDATTLVPRVTVDVLLESLFGEGAAARQRKVADVLLADLARSRGPLAAVGITRDRGIWQTTNRHRDIIDAAILTEIARAQSGEPKGMLADLLESNPTAGPEDVRDAVATLLVTGHETVAIAILWSLAVLAASPDEIAELRRSSSRGSAVASAALRMRPVIPIVIRHASKPIRLDGVTAPAGSRIGLCVFLAEYLAGHKHSYFGSRDRSELLAFGGGSRRCLGEEFAVLEIATVLSTIARICDIKPSSSFRPVRSSIAIRPARRIWLVPRKSPRGATEVASSIEGLEKLT